MPKKEKKSPAENKYLARATFPYLDNPPPSEAELLAYIPYQTAKDLGHKRDAIDGLMRSLDGKPAADLVKRLVQLDVVRPAWVSVEHWEENYPLSEDEKIVVFLTAMGMSEKEISKEMGISFNKIKTLINLKRSQEKISEIRQREFGQNPKKWVQRIEQILPEAIRVAYDIMMDPVVKPAVRLAAAESMMDRVLGKSTQHIEVEDSTIKNVLQKIDEIMKEEKIRKEDRTIDLSKEGPECAKEESSDPIERWVAANPL